MSVCACSCVCVLVHACLYVCCAHICLLLHAHELEGCEGQSERNGKGVNIVEALPHVRHLLSALP